MNIHEPAFEFHVFDTLRPHALFDLLKLRVDVFVVEQNCAYPELDSYDTAASTIHLLGYQGDTLIAYARAMPPVDLSIHNRHEEKLAVRIGRVVVAKQYRGTGIAHTLMTRLIEHLQELYPGLDQLLAAQTVVKSFYASLGFVPVTEAYLEDDIEHIDMRRDFAPVLIHC
ncbi:MAG: GNAT family N-acetyltransferase [Granulosicoccus sp.]